LSIANIHHTKSFELAVYIYMSESAISLLKKSNYFSTIFQNTYGQIVTRLKFDGFVGKESKMI